MARTTAHNAGEQPSNTPTDLGLNSEAQFRTLSARIDLLADEISRMPKPAAFRLADLIQLAVIVLGVLVAIFTAFGLSARIDDVRSAQAAAESRLGGQIAASEARVTTRLDRVTDQVSRLGERTSSMEGADRSVPR